jgi:lipoate-protein ligase A
VVAGRKVIGSAQRRAGGAFLQHGSILLESHGALLAQVLRGSQNLAGGARMAGLAEFLHPAPTPEALAAAVAAGCASAWGVRFLPGEPSGTEKMEARALEASRYRSEDWNAGPPPGDAGGVRMSPIPAIPGRFR